MRSFISNFVFWGGGGHRNTAPVNKKRHTYWVTLNQTLFESVVKFMLWQSRILNTCLAYSKTYLFIRLKNKSAEVSSNAAVFFLQAFFVLLDFNINQVMRENNNYKTNVQVLHPMENVCSFQPFCVPSPNTHTHTQARFGISQECFGST